MLLLAKVIKGMNDSYFITDDKGRVTDYHPSNLSIGDWIKLSGEDIDFISISLGDRLTVWFKNGDAIDFPILIQKIRRI